MTYEITLHRKSYLVILRSAFAKKPIHTRGHKNTNSKIPISTSLTYGLPKVDETDIPVEPIIIAVKSPIYDNTKHFCELLSPHIDSSNSHIKSTRISSLTGRYHITVSPYLVPFSEETTNATVICRRPDTHIVEFEETSILSTMSIEIIERKQKRKQLQQKTRQVYPALKVSSPALSCPLPYN